MIVVDVNLLVYLFVPGPRTAQAEGVARRDPAWAAPFLWRSEFRNVLVGFVRRQALPIDDALGIVQEAERTMAGREFTVVSHQVLQLAARSRCSGYDCEYVALARDLGVSLVTVDRQLLAAFPDTAVTPEAFTT